MGEERGVQGLDGENHLHFVIGEDFLVTPKPFEVKAKTFVVSW